MNELKAELQKLYSDESKHSVYQNVPDFVSAELGYTESIDETWRGDRPRLACLTRLRTPAPGERWMDFGANTGFFTLSLAKQHPHTGFIAVEANVNHARFIERVARYFDLGNVEVMARSVGLNELDDLPSSDFLLHLNVLHHAGHDFDAPLVPRKAEFAAYAERYLSLLRKRARGMLFQMGSNWGGDKAEPLVEMHNDHQKLEIFSGWLSGAGWRLRTISYPRHLDNGSIRYDDVPDNVCLMFDRRELDCNIFNHSMEAFNLDSFPGEFYRRPLFLCDSE